MSSPSLLAVLAVLALAPAARAAEAPSGAQAIRATPTFEEVRKAGFRGFWPTLPQFLTGLNADDPAQAALINSYRYVGSDEDRGGASIDASVVVMPTVKEAKARYRDSIAPVEGQERSAGPRVAADSWRYFEGAADQLATRTLRWRVGRALGRITVADAPKGKRQRWPAAKVARLFKPAAKRARRLSAGRLAAPALSPADQALLPSAGLAPGAETGTVAVPLEAWAVQDTSGNPMRSLAKMRQAGATHLLTRTYLADELPGTTVSLVAFPFDDATAATDWIADFEADTSGSSRDLDPGATGAASGFKDVGWGFELQMAAGTTVGDVLCFDPAAETPPAACETLTRTLAEGWYAELSAP